MVYDSEVRKELNIEWLLCYDIIRYFFIFTTKFEEFLISGELKFQTLTPWYLMHPLDFYLNSCKEWCLDNPGDDLGWWWNFACSSLIAYEKSTGVAVLSKSH